MSAGPRYEYHWADGTTIKKAIKVSAVRLLFFYCARKPVANPSRSRNTSTFSCVVLEWGGWSGG